MPTLPDPTKHLQGYGRRDPVTGMLHGHIHSLPEPSGCRWCGQPRRSHGRHWRPGKGIHPYEAPTRAQTLARMVARRRARLEAPPTQYHAQADWAGDGTPDGEGEELCADCRTPHCARFLRTHRRRLAHQDQAVTDPF